MILLIKKYSIYKYLFSNKIGKNLKKIFYKLAKYAYKGTENLSLTYISLSVLKMSLKFVFSFKFYL